MFYFHLFNALINPQAVALMHHIVSLQSASFVYAYKMIEANQYVDSMLFSRETDASSEVAQGLALGICTLGGGRKSIYEAFKSVDTSESANYTDFALRVIGISSWNEVIKSH